MRAPRRHRRFRYTAAQEATLRLVGAGIATCATGGRLLVTAAWRAPIGERLVAHVAGSSEVVSVALRVISCRPTNERGQLSYIIDATPDEGAPGTPLVRELQPGASAFCIVRRDLPVRIENVSVGGCLVETAVRVEPGSSGELTQTSGRDTARDVVRVARCTPVHGAGSLFHVGVEFVWTEYPPPDSLRLLAITLDTTDSFVGS